MPLISIQATINSNLKLTTTAAPTTTPDTRVTWGGGFNKQNKNQHSIRALYRNINGLSATPREHYTSEADNSNIMLWPVHDKTQQKIVKRGRVQKIVATLTSPEALAAAHIRFITKIAKSKHTMLQVGQRDNRPLDQAERNEEPPD